MRLAIIFAAMLFFSSPAIAQLAVAIQPKALEKTSVVFPGEIIAIDIVVVNLGQKAESGVRLEITTDPELLILEKEGKQQNKSSMTIPEILGGKAVAMPLFLKAKNQTPGKQFVYVSYGTGFLSDVLQTFFVVGENPVKINARLENAFLGLNEEDAISLSISNDSNSALSDINAVLFVSAGIDSKASPFELAELKAGEKTPERRFEFVSGPTTTGSKNLGLEVSYFVDGKRRVFLKEFEVNVSDKASLLALLFLVIVILIVYIALGERQRRKNPAPLEKNPPVAAPKTSAKRKKFPFVRKR